MNLNEDTFLRKLATRHEQKLANILDINNAWEAIAARIPTEPDLLFHPDKEWEPKYNTTNINNFKSMKGSPTRNLLTSWGTRNVTLKHLIQVLRLSNLRHAVNIIEKDILRKPAEQLATVPDSSSSNAKEEAHSSSNPNNSSLNSRVNGEGSFEGYNPAFANGELSQVPSLNSDLSHRLSDISETFGVSVSKSGLVENGLRRLAVESDENSQSPVESQFAPPMRDLSARSATDFPDPPKADLPQADVTAQVKRGWASQGEVEGNPASQGITDVPAQRSALESPSDTNSTPGLSSEDQVLSTCGKDLQIISFDMLKSITNDFDSREESDGGRLIGEGGFGEVFLGLTTNRQRVAVKCLKDNTEDTVKQFLAEIKTLSNYRHHNLVHLIAYSVDGSRRCLVYEYMVNGSLEDRLACKNNTAPLDTVTRLDIVKGTARGLEFLHQNDLVHRDIKSANILLDEDLTPKVGDFATARGTPTEMTTKILLTTKIIGTQVYLPPEAYSGQIHFGLDCYSFGVVLLEILTGLPVLDMERKGHDLKTYVSEHCTEDDDDDDEDEDEEEENNGKEPGTIFDLLDLKAGEWKPELVELLYGISNKCLENKRKKRAKMAQVVKWLESGRIGK